MLTGHTAIVTTKIKKSLRDHTILNLPLLMDAIHMFIRPDRSDGEFDGSTGEWTVAVHCVPHDLQ